MKSGSPVFSLIVASACWSPSSRLLLRNLFRCNALAYGDGESADDGDFFTMMMMMASGMTVLRPLSTIAILGILFSTKAKRGNVGVALL